ncbi:MAG: hypothetical protein AMXMBFR84_04910 [Candidatus Hydrogenedentota bacterium]
MKRFLAATATIALAFAALVPAQKNIDTARSHAFDEELLYLPEQRILRHFTGGMNSLVADLLWIQCIQYTAQQFRGEYKFTWLNQMFDTITMLDPYFCDVYQKGGQFLAMLKADSDASIALLQQGIPHNPERWELPFEIARTYILNRGDETSGAHYLAMAAATGNPPDFVVDWAKNLQLQHDLDDVQRSMWVDIRQNNPDPTMKKLAERKLVELDLRAVCKQLNAAVEAYKQQLGAPPETLKDLWDAGLAQGDLADPLGGRFFLNSDHEVQNTSLLDSIKEDRLRVIQGWIQLFEEKEGRRPARLEELVERGIASGLPTYPYEEGSWQYDPADGSVK